MLAKNCPLSPSLTYLKAPQEETTTIHVHNDNFVSLEFLPEF